MTRKRLLFISFIGLILLLIVSGIISALIRLVNFQAFVIASILFLYIYRYKKSSAWKQIIKKLIYGSKNNSLNPKYKPFNKKQAAKKSLESIDKLIDRIQNNVALKVLTQERERVEDELSRGDLVVVIFGMGSSGKTSLIRALLNEIVGETGPAMGSTYTSISYRLRLKGLSRGIKLIDTPGILESGKEGRAREKEALIKASQADLMIVVVDSDLRETEFKIIKNLSKVGKRLIIALNKIDLRGIDEEQQLLSQLRGRTQELIAPEDIISTTAAPQSIPQPGNSPIQPLPEIDALVRRLAKVLYQEGEELLADNILLQCRNLGNKGRRILNNQREQKARRCIDRYGWISSGVVVITPLPGIELLGTAAVNTQMVIEIANIYGILITRERAKELTLSVVRTLAGLGIVQGGVNLIGSALSLNLPTLLVGRALQGVTAAWLTRVAGASFITYFNQDQDWGDGGIQEVVQHQYDLNRREETLRKFIDNALQRVVEPLKSNHYKQLPPRQRLQEEEEA
tara:strand:- start:18779 stop:20320 length:1542 start_codon:yes stop_codon:yes gene_type:complete